MHASELHKQIWCLVGATKAGRINGWEHGYVEELERQGLAAKPESISAAQAETIGQIYTKHLQ